MPAHDGAVERQKGSNNERAKAPRKEAPKAAPPGPQAAALLQLQRLVGNAAVTQLLTAEHGPSLRHAAIAQPGRPLDGGTREAMESHFALPPAAEPTAASVAVQRSKAPMQVDF